MTSPVIGASALVSFSFQSSFNVRIVTVDGEPWFMAKDVATALGYADTDQAVRNHCKRAKSLKDIDPLNQRVEQNQELDPKTKFIPEPDVYRLITRSKLPSAEAFETWLFETVIPSIRKTGAYQLPAPAPEVETLSAQQYDELTRALRPLYGLLNNESVQTAIHDHVRVTMGVRHLKDSSAERARHQDRVARVRHKLRAMGIPMLDNPSHIIPVMVGDPKHCKMISDWLLDNCGIYVQPINYPTVPKGTERLRITPSPLHTDADIDQLVDALSEIWARCELSRVASAA